MATPVSKNVDYVSQVPTYSYKMPCGAVFRSQTYSVAEETDGLHWFPCKETCHYTSADRSLVVQGYHAFSDKEVRKIERQPRDAGKENSTVPHDHKNRASTIDNLGTGRKLGETALARRLDEAMVRDRVASYFRLNPEAPVTEVSESTGASHMTVKRVAMEIGVHGINDGDTWDRARDESPAAKIRQAKARVDILRRELKYLEDQKGRPHTKAYARHRLEAAEAKLEILIQANRTR